MHMILHIIVTYLIKYNYIKLYSLFNVYWVFYFFLYNVFRADLIFFNKNNFIHLYTSYKFKNTGHCTHSVSHRSVYTPRIFVNMLLYLFM